MNFKERCQLLRTAPGPLKTSGVPAGKPQRLSQQLPLSVAHTCEIVPAELAGNCAAAEGGQPEGIRLFSAEGHQLQRMPGNGVVIRQHLHYLQCQQHTKRTVIFASIWHCIYMGAKSNNRKRII
ncbi:hypothetical protein D3C80_1550470 [compost metagenome]